jgi:hypothetical protein
MQSFLVLVKLFQIQETSELLQPKQQWPDGRSTQSTGFRGYAPNIDTPGLDAVFSSHPSAIRRLRAAALLDPARADWATFD